MPQYDEAVRRLYEEGRPLAEIQREVGISMRTVYQALRRAGGEPGRKPGAGKLSDAAKAFLAGLGEP